MSVTMNRKRSERNLAHRRHSFAFASQERHAGSHGAIVSAQRERMRRRLRKEPGALDEGP